ncbi:amino acid adenylation domain-containing protein [Eionea flava]
MNREKYSASPSPKNDNSLVKIFERQVKKTPKNIAISFEAESLSYEQLNERVNQLALSIIDSYEKSHRKPLSADTLIGVYLDRSAEMIIGLLAVLKAGGAYVPISPEFPLGRTAFILNDASLSLLVTQKKYLKKLDDLRSDISGEFQLVLADDPKKLSEYSSNNLDYIVSGKNLSYVIYTSGTTGNPKGVMVEHCSVVNLIESQSKFFSIDESDIFLLLSSYIFDASVEVIFLSLLNGGLLLIPSESDIHNPEIIKDIISSKEVTHLDATPSYLSMITPINRTHKIRRVISGGEPCGKSLTEYWQPLLANVYGPTEATVTVTRNFPHGDSSANCIGLPIDNISLHVLDKDLSPVKKGEPGELYIGGAGVVRGYLNQPLLTEKCFIHNPFASEEEKLKGYTRLYKTGDIAKRLPDDTLEYLGRDDAQVKIRGFRIELGEVEHALQTLDEVHHAVVIDKEDNGRRYLAAYLVIQPEADLDQSAIYTYLSSILPEYMVPSSLSVIDLIPLTANGKLDRDALPAPVFFDTDNIYIPPRNFLEEKISAIWRSVLNLHRIGIHENFFRIGGDSISAVKLAAEISREFSKHISAAKLFECKTIAVLAESIENEEKIALEVITKSNVSKPPLSFSQQSLFFIERFEQGTDAYHIPYVFKLHENVDQSHLCKAFNIVIDRHPVLKTVYLSDENGEYYQHVLDDEVAITSSILLPEDSIDLVIQKEIETPFNLSAEPSIRLRTYSIGNKVYFLMLFHHIAFDGWSESVFLNELSHAYEAAKNGKAVSLPDLNIRYLDYAVWQRESLKGDTLETAVKYWKKHLSGYEPLQLPIDYPRPNKIDYRGKNLDFSFTETVSKKLVSLAKSEEVTLHSLLLSGLYVTLSMLSGQEDIVIGTPSDGREEDQTQGLVGYFVNSFPLRIELDKTQSAGSLMADVHRVVTQAKAHQLPFDKVVDALDVQRSSSLHPLYQVMFSIDNFDKSHAPLPFDEVPLKSKNSSAKFDLSLEMKNKPACADKGFHIQGVFNYALGLFDENSVNHIADIYQRVINSFVADSTKLISQLDILTVEDRNRILYDWNKTDADYACNVTLVSEFEKQVINSPDKIALVFGDESLTYKELNAKANQLSSALLAHYCNFADSKRMPVGSLIGLYMDRSLGMVISILAVLKAGGAYVPMSPEYPQARVIFMLKDAEIPLVITQLHYEDLLSGWLSETSISLLSADDEQRLRQHSVNNSSLDVEGSDLAYIIYTSGTTGHPKGVMIEHHSICNLVFSQRDAFKFDNKEVALWLSNYIFDASIESLFLSLLSGAQLVIPTRDMADSPNELQAQIITQGITHLDATPSQLSVLSSVTIPNSIKRVVSGGEPCSEKLVAAWGDLLINAYGPTEATVTSTRNINHSQASKNCIGKPIDNVRVYVLDKQQCLVPVGVQGELYIAGAGVARGYLNNQSLTQKRFLKNPFIDGESSDKGYDRLYKTGDLVRWLPNGTLEYLGRNDSQVKIRGFRIELREIEESLMSLDDVDQCAVTYSKKTGQNILACYLVMKSKNTLDEEKVRSAISRILPEYMMPNTFTLIDSIPLTTNGKIDYNALPDPSYSHGNAYVAPRNDLEKKLCSIWKTVVGIQSIGVHDNFFRIGGDSIVSIQLVLQLRKSGFQVQVKTIFDFPTVAELAIFLSEKIPTKKVIVEQKPLSGKFDLLPIQQWFFDQGFDKPNHWNQAFMIALPKGFEDSDISDALYKISAHHDILRCKFLCSEKNYKQFCVELDDFDISPLKKLDVSSLSSEEVEQKLTSWQSDFEINEGNLWRSALLHGYPDGKKRLWLAFHHLIIDSVSWRIIRDDVEQLLLGNSLQEKGSSYGQWIESIKEYANKNRDQINYWNNIAENKSLHSFSEKTSEKTIIFSENFTNKLLRTASKAYNTEINDLLLSALAITLGQVFETKTNHITLEGHGRELIDESVDISSTVGWFTSMYPVKLTSFEDISETIVRTKESLRSIPDKGIGYGIFSQQGLIDAELPKIFFNYLGQINQTQKSGSNDWELIIDGCGEVSSTKNVDQAFLNINGFVDDNTLIFSIESRMPENLEKRFFSVFRDSIEKVIDHGDFVAKTKSIKTPSDYEYSKISIEQLKSLQKKYEVEEIYPANSLQQGFIYHQLNFPKDSAYRVQLLLDYHNNFDANIYRNAWKSASECYPALRTAFDWEKDMLQIITGEPSITENNFIEEDISSTPINTHESLIAEFQKREREKSFDLRQPAPIRFCLIKQSSVLTTVLITEHHSISDGWSGPILLDAVHKCYDNLMNNNAPSMVIDKAYKEAQSFYRKNMEKSNLYWDEFRKKKLTANDIGCLVNSGADIFRNPEKRSVLKNTLSIEGSDYTQLKRMCRSHGLTVNVVLQFSWHKLIEAYTKDSKTLVGTTVSGRDIPVENIEDSVGLYINTLPLEVDWKKSDEIIKILNSIQKSISEINSYSSVSLSSLQSGAERLFHSLFVFENYPEVDSTSSCADSIGNNVEFKDSIEEVDYPLTVMAYEKLDGVEVVLSADDSLLSQEKANMLLSHMKNIIREVIENPRKPHSSISIMDEKEREKIKYDWSSTSFGPTNNETLVNLFENQVKKTPSAKALIFGEISISYEELNRKANQLAREIQKSNNRKLSADTLVGLYLDRGVDMIVGIFAVLKSGGAYVSISPTFPSSRTDFIINDTSMNVLVTQYTYQEKLKNISDFSSNKPNLIIADNNELLDKNSSSNLDVMISEKDLSYVIYTSGTTGKPKGVMISHQNAVSFLEAQKECFGTLSCKKMLNFSSSVFDASVFEIFSSLCNGLSLYLCSELDQKDPMAISSLIEKEKIDIALLPPAILSSLDISLLDSLNVLITGGESPSSVALDRLNSARRNIFNAYGPTEITVCASVNPYKNKDLATNIGRPVKNTYLYVLDSDQSLSPTGVVGELYIGGAGVARGYLNQPELTRERFICNSFASKDDQLKGYTRLYKTGDLVRWLPDGSLEYMGRNDKQVKIRGFRIELGEIEHALNMVDGVKQAVVIDREKQGRRYLAAYLVMNTGALLDKELTSSLLSKTLPDYMIPNSFSVIESIPLTINGKLDRQALPEPILSLEDNTYVSPRNSLEETICAIWKSVLGLEKIGIYDNFFQIGGDSITAVRLASEISNALGKSISVAQIFESKTVAKLTESVISTKANIQVIKRSEAVHPPLSFSQQSLLFIERFEQGTSAYHIPYVFRLHRNVNQSNLLEAFNVVINRHPILKTIYLLNNAGEYYQHILEKDVDLKASILPSDDMCFDAIHKEIQTPFNLSADPSIRLSTHSTDQTVYLLVLFHHIAFDGWSENIFMNELSAAYEAVLNKKVATLPGIDISYADYAVWQRETLKGDALTCAIDYWRDSLSNYEPLSLPTDYPRPSHVDYRGQNLEFNLSEALSSKLIALAKSEGVTLYSVLLSGLYVTLSALSGQEDIIVGTPSDGRQENQTQSLIGYFVNSLALRIVLNKEQSIESLIASVHRLVSQAKTHQFLPFDKVVDALGVEHSSSMHPLYQVMFSVNNFDKNDLPLPFDEIILDQKDSPAKFDLSLEMKSCSARDGDAFHIQGVFNYATSLFSPESIQRNVEMYQRVLEGFVANSSQALSQLDTLPPEERNKVLYDWNSTDSHYAKDATLVSLFEAQVNRAPNNTALAFDKQTLSYQELNERVNQLSSAITERYRDVNLHDMPTDTLIGIYMDRSLEMVISILAILKAGGAYVPMSPEHPQARVVFMVNDTEMPLILTQENHLESLSAWLSERSTPVSLLNVENPQGLSHYPVANPPLRTTASDLAYVIYTSGTTGNPKGVMVEHGSICNLIKSQTAAFEFNENENALWLLAYIFDASIEVLFLSLLNGAQLSIPTLDTINSPNKIKKIITHEKITHLTATSSYLSLLGEITCGSSIRRVVSGGEPCSESVSTIWGDLLINAYGPTEATVTSTRSMSHNKKPRNSIGKPIDNVRVYVLNDNQSPVPVGVKGELYISGAGLARGYLNQKVLTDERFTINPFASDKDKVNGYERIYRTGDVVRWLPNGTLEYLGRNDSQIKVRGFRVELAEVEQSLQRIDGIKQGIVSISQVGEKNSLACHLMMKPGVVLKEELIRATLLKTLPEYMVPSTFTQIESIPLTANGKIDYRALPKPSNSLEVVYSAPETETEAIVSKIWAELLDIPEDTISRHDQFFYLGGHSILAISAVNKIEKNFPVIEPLKSLMKNESLKKLAKSIDDKQKKLLDILSEIEIVFDNDFDSHSLGLKRVINQLDNDKKAYCEKRALEEGFQLSKEQFVSETTSSSSYSGEWFPASGSQILHLNYRRDPSHDVVASMLQFKEIIDPSLLFTSVKRLTEEYQSFRLYFKEIKASSYNFKNSGRWLQRETKDELKEESGVVINFDIEDCSKENFEKIYENACNELIRSIDIFKPFLFRFAVFNHSSLKGSRVVFIMHHLICDLVSANNIIARLHDLYASSFSKKIADNPKENISYFDYLKWQHHQLESENLENEVSHWINHDKWRDVKNHVNQRGLLIDLNEKEKDSIYKLKNSTTKTIVWSEDDSKKFIDFMSKKHDLWVYDGLILFVAHCMSRIKGSGFMPAWIMNSGRESSGINLMESVGYLSLHYIAGFKLNNNLDLSDWISNFKNELLEANHNSHKFSALYFDRYDVKGKYSEVANKIQSIPSPDILFNFSSVSESLSEKEFSLHPVENTLSEENNDYYNMSFTFGVIDGKVNINVKHNRLVHSDIFVDRLCQEIENCLGASNVNEI